MQAVVTKLRFKVGGVVLYAPKELAVKFEELGLQTSFQKNQLSTSTLVFINNKKEFLDFLSTGMKNVESDSILWFAYPKGTSKVKTDINRDTLTATAEGFGVTAVASISIDDTWSALRFRPIDRVGK